MSKFWGIKYGGIVVKHMSDIDFDFNSKINSNKELNSNEKSLLEIIFNHPCNFEPPLRSQSLIILSKQGLKYHDTINSLKKKGYLKEEVLFIEDWWKGEKEYVGTNLHFYFGPQANLC